MGDPMGLFLCRGYGYGVVIHCGYLPIAISSHALDTLFSRKKLFPSAYEVVFSHLRFVSSRSRRYICNSLLNNERKDKESLSCMVKSLASSSHYIVFKLKVSYLFFY
jgi:hypothetical protein